MKRTSIKKPKSVKLGPHTVPIRYVPHVEYGTAYGCFDPATLNISIDETIEGALLVETIIHEIIEAVNFLFELNLKHNKIQTLGLLIA